MQKETATEWLFKQLWEEPKDKFTWNAILSKAKEMHKEEIINAVDLPKEKNIARAFLILGFILGVLTTISISL
jgi:hypothetical protein